MRRKGFTLTEVFICMLILLTLMSGISVLIRGESSENIAKEDMDRLARWLNDAFARADRWKRGFYLYAYLSKGDDGSYMILTWKDGEASAGERFSADSRLRWSFYAGNQNFEYNWSTHSVSPAFTMAAVNNDGSSTGETLTVSVRALVTREGAGSK